MLLLQMVSMTLQTPGSMGDETVFILLTTISLHLALCCHIVRVQ